MERCLGSFPTSIVERSKLRKRYFDSHGRSRVECLSRDGQRHVRKMPRLQVGFPTNLPNLLNSGGAPAHRVVMVLQDFAADQPKFCLILEGLLRIDPDARISAEDALHAELFL